MIFNGATEKKKRYQCRNGKFIYSQFFPNNIFSTIFALINLGIRLWCFCNWTCLLACNTILRFSMQRMSFTHWPWMPPASWNHIDKIINFSLKTKSRSQFLVFPRGKIYSSILLFTIDACINHLTCNQALHPTLVELAPFLIPFSFFYFL